MTTVPSYRQRDNGKSAADISHRMTTPGDTSGTWRLLTVASKLVGSFRAEIQDFHFSDRQEDLWWIIKLRQRNTLNKTIQLCLNSLSLSLCDVMGGAGWGWWGWEGGESMLMTWNEFFNKHFRTFRILPHSTPLSYFFSFWISQTTKINLEQFLKKNQGLSSKLCLQMNHVAKMNHITDMP